MIINKAKAIRLPPPFIVKRIMLGNIEIWSTYLELKPECIWLTEENNNTETVEVISNTDWKIQE